MSGRAHPNVLVVGPCDVVDVAVRALLSECRQPVLAFGRTEALELPSPAQPGTLVLRDVADRPLGDQHRLMVWLGATDGRAQVISTNGHPWWSGLEAGTFLPGLYYRLNVIHFDFSQQTPDDVATFVRRDLRPGDGGGVAPNEGPSRDLQGG